jgi:hypothetical protein
MCCVHSHGLPNPDLAGQREVTDSLLEDETPDTISPRLARTFLVEVTGIFQHEWSNEAEIMFRHIYIYLLFACGRTAVYQEAARMYTATARGVGWCRRAPKLWN